MTKAISVVGMDEKAAAETLRALGIDVLVIERDGTHYPDGDPFYWDPSRVSLRVAVGRVVSQEIG